MLDVVSKEVRSKMMSAVRWRDTGPERQVRQKIFSLGYRYRLHIKKLPGKPDIVFLRQKIAVFVHGCFWHGHSCPKGRRPKSNTRFWNKKLSCNSKRDQNNQKALKAKGWRVCVIWECSLNAGIRNLVRMLRRQPN